MIVGPALLNFRLGESRITLWPTDKGGYTVMLARMKQGSMSTEYFNFPTATCAVDAIAGIFATMK